jgi:monothiol glutaredoxin
MAQMDQLSVRMSMIVYVKHHCPWCHEALAYLDEHGFTYEMRDVVADPEAMERMREISRQSLTPTMEVDGKVLADFDTGQLSEFLEANGITA